MRTAQDPAASLPAESLEPLRTRIRLLPLLALVPFASLLLDLL